MAKAKKQVSFEDALWGACDKLRGTVEPAEYKHVVLSLIFLKFVNDKFDARRQELKDEGKEKYIDVQSFYTMKNVFFVPEESRWSFIMQNAKQNDIALKIQAELHRAGRRAFPLQTACQPAEIPEAAYGIALVMLQQVRVGQHQLAQ